MKTLTFKTRGDIRVGMAVSVETDSNEQLSWLWDQPASGDIDSYTEVLRVSDGAVFGTVSMQDEASGKHILLDVYQGIAGHVVPGPTTTYDVRPPEGEGYWLYDQNKRVGSYSGGQLLKGMFGNLLRVHGYATPPFVTSQDFGTFSASWPAGLMHFADGSVRLMSLDPSSLSAYISTALGGATAINLALTVPFVIPAVADMELTAFLVAGSVVCGQVAANAVTLGVPTVMDSWVVADFGGGGVLAEIWPGACSVAGTDGVSYLGTYVPSELTQWLSVQVHADGTYETPTGGQLAYPAVDPGDAGFQVGNEQFDVLHPTPGVAPPNYFWREFVKAYEQI